MLFYTWHVPNGALSNIWMRRAVLSGGALLARYLPLLRKICNKTMLCVLLELNFVQRKRKQNYIDHRSI